MPSTARSYHFLRPQHCQFDAFQTPPLSHRPENIWLSETSGKIVGFAASRCSTCNQQREDKQDGRSECLRGEGQLVGLDHGVLAAKINAGQDHENQTKLMFFSTSLCWSTINPTTHSKYKAFDIVNPQHAYRMSILCFEIADYSPVMQALVDFQDNGTIEKPINREAPMAELVSR